MNNAIVTCAWGELPDYWYNIVLPRFKFISNKWNVNFHIIDTELENINNKMYNKIQIGEVCKQYDRIFYIDNDCVISRDTPNIFETFKKGKFYGVLDSTIHDTDCQNRISEIKYSQEKFGNINWNVGYYNAGIFLCDKEHSKIWENFVFVNFIHTDQTWINYFLRKYKFDHEAISKKYNSMGINTIKNDSKEILYGAIDLPERICKAVYIAHAAGVPNFLKNYYIEKFDEAMK